METWLELYEEDLPKVERESRIEELYGEFLLWNCGFHSSETYLSMLDTLLLEYPENALLLKLKNFLKAAKSLVVCFCTTGTMRACLPDVRILPVMLLLGNICFPHCKSNMREANLTLKHTASAAFAYGITCRKRSRQKNRFLRCAA